MMKYKQQIKEYKEEIEKKYVRIEAENRTVKACQNILSESILSKQSHRTSYFEFLYEQTKFIKLLNHIHKKKMVDFTRLCSYVSMDMVE